MILRNTTWTLAIVSAVALVAVLNLPIGVAAEPEKANAPAPAPTSEPQNPTPDQPAKTEPQAQELKVLTGELVDMHSFIMQQSAPASQHEPRGKGPLNFMGIEVPIGLWVQEEATLAKLTPGRPVYLVLFDPTSGEQKSAYLAARRMVGEKVKVTGRTYEREGLRAFYVQTVEPRIEVVDAN